MDYRKDMFRKASKKWIDLAEAQLATQGQQHTAPYLVHVALECSLKVRILANAKANSTEAFRKQRGDELWSMLFKSRKGHSLSELAEKASLKRLLTAKGPQDDPLKGPAWQRMVDSERPYSLRYGARLVGAKPAREEFDLGKRIVDLIEGSDT